LSSDTVARYRKCCEVVVDFCDRRDVDVLPASVVDEFVAYQQERARLGEIGRNRRNALVKTARMMLELQRTGEVAWRVMSPDAGLSESSCEVLEQFAAAAGRDVTSGSVRLLTGEIRHFLVCLDRIGRGCSRCGHCGRCPEVHDRDGAEAACGHRQLGVVAHELLRLPQRGRAQ
jgi:hypothetical protein